MAQKRPDRVLGAGHDDFWNYCGQGQLRLQRCASCKEINWPVVQKCDNCGGAEFTWDKMSGRGKIVSWCAFEKDYYGGVLPMPWDTILVELEEGPLFISNPDGFSFKDIKIDMPVRLSFVACEDKAGAFQLPVFSKA